MTVRLREYVAEFTVFLEEKAVLCLLIWVIMLLSLKTAARNSGGNSGGWANDGRGECKCGTG